MYIGNVGLQYECQFNLTMILKVPNFIFTLPLLFPLVSFSLEALGQLTSHPRHTQGRAPPLKRRF